MKKSDVLTDDSSQPIVLPEEPENRPAESTIKSKDELPESIPKAAIYSVNELISNAAIFGISRDMTEAALTLAGVKACTLDEAKRIVGKFAERKVR